jgi:hypothetical protein
MKWSVSIEAYKSDWFGEEEWPHLIDSRNIYLEAKDQKTAVAHAEAVMKAIYPELEYYQCGGVENEQSDPDAVLRQVVRIGDDCEFFDPDPIILWDLRKTQPAMLIGRPIN